MSLAVGAVVVAASDLVLAPPPTVDVEVTNRGAFDIRVQVSSGGDGWITAGSVASTSGRTLRLVIDQGERWLIRFTHAGVEGGTIDLPGDVVRSNGVEVPPQVETELRAAGLRPRRPR